MAEQEKDPLFPALPEDLKSLSDDEVQKLLDDHVSAAALIEADDEEFLAGLTADEIIAQLATGVEQIKALQAENKERVRRRTRTTRRRRQRSWPNSSRTEEDEGGDEGDAGDESTEEAEVVAEAERDCRQTRRLRLRRWWRNRFRSRRPLPSPFLSHPAGAREGADRGGDEGRADRPRARRVAQFKARPSGPARPGQPR